MIVLARIVIIIFAIEQLLGLVWFSFSQGTLFIMPSLVAIATGLLLALVPMSFSTATQRRRALFIGLGILGVASGLILIFQDIAASTGPEYDVALVRTIFALAIVILIVKLWNASGSKEVG